MPVIKCHLGNKNWLNQWWYICFDRGLGLGWFAGQYNEVRVRLLRSGWLQFDEITLRPAPLRWINMQPGSQWNVFSPQYGFLYVPSSWMRQIETRCGEKFFNIECRRAGWGGLSVVRKTIAMWDAALLSGLPNYLPQHPHHKTYRNNRNNISPSNTPLA